jgi:hypothetical protein
MPTIHYKFTSTIFLSLLFHENTIQYTGITVQIATPIGKKLKTPSTKVTWEV